VPAAQAVQGVSGTSGLGIPQDRIAKRLGLARTSFQYHLPKMAALPNSAKADLSRGFTVAQVAEKQGWHFLRPFLS
jgi:hypothetical protein